MKTNKIKTSPWTETGANVYTRQYGPLKATVYRSWTDYSKEPEQWKCFFNIGEDLVVLPIEEVGVEWFEDEHEAAMLKEMHRRIVKHIKGWLK